MDQVFDSERGRVKPITPNEIAELKGKLIDPEMIQAVNELLALKYVGGSSITLRQDEVINKYFELKGLANTPTNRKNIFDKHQLDFEELYQKSGWKVSYDKPGYNETYEPTWEFELKKKNGR